MNAKLQDKQRQLVEKYSPLVRQIAGAIARNMPRNVLRDDLVAAGMLGLWDAIIRNPSMGDGFEWYLRVRIRGAIVDGLRTEDWVKRRARLLADSGARAAPAIIRFDELSPSDLSAAMAVEANAIDIDASTRQEGLHRAIAELPPRWRNIILRNLAGESMHSIATQLGVSPPRISQIRSKAIQRLRDSRHLKREK